MGQPRANRYRPDKVERVHDFLEEFLPPPPKSLADRVPPDELVSKQPTNFSTTQPPSAPETLQQFLSQLSRERLVPSTRPPPTCLRQQRCSSLPRHQRRSPSPPPSRKTSSSSTFRTSKTATLRIPAPGFQQM